MSQSNQGQANNDPNHLNNLNRVDNALSEILLPGLRPFIKRKMKDKYGANWLDDRRVALQSYHFVNGDLNWEDPQPVLHLLLTQWKEVFCVKNKFDHYERNLVSELKEIRNQVHHKNLWKFDDESTWRAFDSIARLLKAIPDDKVAREKAQEAEQQKKELMQLISPQLAEKVLENPNREINWLSLFRAVLDTQTLGNLTTNPLTAGEGMEFKQNEIYVPLGLVERKQREKFNKDDGSPEKGSNLYQETLTPIENNKFLEQVLKQDKPIAIIGEPGAGKTTRLQNIGELLLEKTEDLPIWVSLGAIGTKSLREYLLSDWLRDAAQELEAAPPEWKEALGQLLKSGKVWLLLDGVDEMAADNSLQQIASQLREGWAKNVRVVLTCRLNVWDANKNPLYHFDVYRNLDFKPEQVGQFISNWFKNSNPKMGNELQKALAQSGKERIRDLVKNPLRLALLCRTWQSGQGELPDTKAQIYHQFVQAVYDWKQEYFPTDEAQQKALSQALGKLALQAINGQESRFRLRDSFIRQVMSEFEPELLHLALDLGWLNRVGVAAENTHEKVYAFYHPTFEEYFAALNIDDWHYFLNHVPDNPAQGTYRIFEPQWKEVILLWLGREGIPKEQKEEFIKALREFRDGCNGFYGYRAYFLASASIAEFGNCDCTDEILEQLVKWSIDNYNPYQEIGFWLDPVMEAAEAALRETHINHAIAVLNKWFNSNQDEHIHLRLIPLLTSIAYGNSDANHIMIKLMSEKYSDEIRCEAALSLGKIAPETPDIFTTLIELLRTNPSVILMGFHNREDFTKICATNQEIIDILIEFSKTSTTEKTEDICISAYQALKEISTENPDNFAIKSWELAEKQESRPKPKESSNQTNTNLLETINTLSDILNNTEDSNIDIFMVDKLGSMAIGTGNQNAIAALSKMLNSSDYYIRSQAAHHLWRIYPNKSDAIYVLTNLLNSNDDGIRLESARNLWEIDPGNEDVINTLTNLLDSHDLNICYEAACSLSKFDPDNEEAIYTLMEIVYINHDQNKSRIPQPYDEAGDELIKILPCDWYSLVIGYLKDCQHDAAFEVIWQCAQNMLYPEFYAAWHSESSNTTHPEVLEISAIGNKTQTQNLILANLPQLLKSAIANDPNLNQKIHKICINASEFIKEHRDNPASEIYAEMVIAGCPERLNGEPETMQSLKVYCKLLKSDKKVVLVFYDSTALEPESIGFSNSFLDDLSQFGEEICVVTDQPLKKLKQFSPSQPQLVENILGWMRAIALENLPQ